MSDEAIVAFYEDDYDEADRLAANAHGQLEYFRTQHLIVHRIGDRPLTIADVGGGPGMYAAWLAGRGHCVELIDPVDRHVEQAQRQPAGLGSLRARVGDARRLELADESVDAALLLGPLYHLANPGDRELALTEARRVLRPGGWLFAAAISRFSSFHDGLARGWLSDPRFAAIVRSDLETGHHENPTSEPGWFTNAYFHRPEELHPELANAGFVNVEVHGVEGLAGWLPDLQQQLDDPHERETVLEWLDHTGTEPSILGVSAHLLACARAPS